MIYGAVGRRERGKTTLAYSLASRITIRVIFDPRRLIETGSARAETPEELQAMFAQLGKDEAFNEILVTPADDVQIMFEETCRHVATRIRDNPDQSIALLIDEARFVDLQCAPLEWILRCAPRNTVHVFFTCHRPADLSVNVRAILDQWLLFHCVQEHDLEVIRERCGKQVSEKVSKLKAYQWIQWDDGSGEAFEHNDPTTWYRPLRSRPNESITVIDEGTPVDPVDKQRVFEY